MVQAKRKRVPVVEVWGRYLQGFRARMKSQPSVEAVAKMLRGKGVPADDASVRSYEYGWIERPDPVILHGLADLYRVDVAELIAALAANRRNRQATPADLQESIEVVRKARQANAGAAAKLAILREEIVSHGTRLLRLANDEFDGGIVPAASKPARDN